MYQITIWDLKLSESDIKVKIAINNLKHNIVQHRKRLGLTQQELANLLNITRTSVSGYERGDRVPYNDILIKLSLIFDITIDSLYKNYSA